MTTLIREPRGAIAANRSRLWHVGCTVILAVTIACGGLASVADAQRDKRKCGSPRSKTVIRNKVARVFTKQERVGFYLCSYRSGKKHFIGPRPSGLDNERFSRFRLAGRFLAYERFYAPFRADPGYSIAVRDARTARIKRSADGAPFEVPAQEFKSDDGIRDLVVNRSGAVGWIVQNPYTTGSRVEVRKSTAEGDMLLDKGDGIEATSLTLKDNILKWENSGDERSAPLE